MRYFEHKDFMPSVRAMNVSGGRLSKAVSEVQALLGRILQGEINPFSDMPQTQRGETRIANCIKYDLVGYARLVTVLYRDIQVLLFAGSHDAVDAWLNSHKGVTFAADRSGTILEMKVSRIDEQGTKVKISSKPDIYNGPIMSRLPFDDAQRILERLSGKDVFNLQQLMVGATPEVISAYSEMVSDTALRMPIYDILTMLNAGDIDGAINRIGLMDGEIRNILDLSPGEMLEIRDGADTKQIKIGSDDYQKWINNYIKSSNYQDWFLFMHPEQEAFVNSDYSGPAKLSGISGSGKTCIAVRRAVRLAQKNPNSRIAILTLNRSLAELISTLVDHVVTMEANLRSRIEVKSLFSLCQDLLLEFEPENTKLYHDVTWGLEEHIDEIFREYYRLGSNFHLGEVLLPLHRQLTANGIDAESYVRDEFDWLRSVLPIDSRDDYLDIERSGRGMPLLRDARKLVLGGLHGWESKMKTTGVIDYLGLTTALSRHIGQISPRFTSIIVDEVQDFGTTELAMLRKLVPRGENDMFFCGDLAQHILPKHLVFQDADVDVTGRSFTIRRNYRNSREILKAAQEVLFNILDEPMIKQSELELLDPEYANRSSAAPVVCVAKDLGEEIKAALLLMKDNENIHDKDGRPHRGCIAVAGHSLYEIEIFGREHGIPVLDGTIGLKSGTLFLSDLEQTKGYEFDTMIIVNCCADALPPKGVPPAEAFRYGSQLYVAMTRATTLLVLSYSGEPSPWLTAKNINITFDKWENFVDLKAGKDIGVPGYLPENIDPEEDGNENDVMSLNGRQFLFTSYALGMNADLQQKIDELVVGQNVLRGKNRIKWKNVGLLRDNLIYGGSRGRTGYVFGPTADSEVREILDRAKSGLRPVARKPRSKSPSIQPPPPAPPEVVKPGIRNRRAIDSLLINELGLTSRTYVLLHEMKLRTIGDLVKLGTRALASNAKVSGWQIDEISDACKKFGVDLPLGDLKKPQRRRP